VPQLSPREREIMHLMAEGMTAEQIANQLSVSIETVRTHVRNVIRKLRARNRVHAIALALERGEIALSDADASRGD
jgi:DNA-binding CsgD family transcriptional regulator